MDKEDLNGGEELLKRTFVHGRVWPEGHHNLDIIAERCGFDLKNHHNALADAEACADPISKI